MLVTTPTEVAGQMGTWLEKVSGVSDLTWGPLEDGAAFLQGCSHRGRFYTHLWPNSEGHLEGVQALATVPGTNKKPLHLGYWRPTKRLSGGTESIATRVWAELVQQDRENQEQDMYSWIPVHRLPG